MVIDVLQGVSALILGGTLIQAAASLYRVARQSVRVRRREAQAFEGFIRKARNAVDLSRRPKRNKIPRGWTGLRKFYIERKVQEGDTAYSFYLRPHDGKPLPPFLPGQYLTIELKIPGESRPVVRCYSLSEAPLSRQRYRITVKRIREGEGGEGSPEGLVSSFLHEHMHEGATLDARAPGGRFFLDIRETRPIVLIGGGVGITPLMSMLNTVCAFGLERQVWLFYGVRNSSQHIMKDKLKELSEKHPNIHIVTCYSHPTANCRKGRDYDHKGRVSVPLMRFLVPFNKSVFYLCGPSAMMKSMTDGLRESGVADQDIRLEAFGPASVSQTAETTAPERRGKDSATVTFARSGKSLTWGQGKRNLLELAEANGISMSYGCRAGQCGSCAVKVKEGQVRHVGTPGETPAKGHCLACIAVPEGDLVVDA